MPVEETAADWDETRLAATKKKPKPKPPRKPEEVWYDVHKHPEGVPGGMGKSPEHHLRNRGWTSREIHGATSKTMQYHNPSFPDFVISYGGGTSTKPDHNFRVLYMGTNRNVPKVHHTYSVADAMNKVEELHSMQSGHVVLPMTHGASLATQPNVSENNTFVATPQPKRRRDMNKDDAHPIGPPPTYTNERFPTRPDEHSDWVEPKQLQEIPDPPKATPKKQSRVGAVYQRADQESWEEA
jgi:hypothetical protein